MAVLMEPLPSQGAADLIAALSASGFPLQTAVASAIRTLGIYDVEEEVAWCNLDGSDKFLDIVAVGKRVRVMLECKKTIQERFVFLLPAGSGKDQPQDVLQCVYLHQIQDSTRRGAVFWGTASSPPASHESAFCVAKSASSNRLLENDVQPLVRATEAYALDRYQAFKPRGGEPTSIPCVPVLVTNAPLFLARYLPSDVSLETGIYRARAEHLVAIQYMRFTKEFTTSRSVRVRRRTAFITQASAVSDLLTNLSVATIINPDDGAALAA